jgi:hypothetical protein
MEPQMASKPTERAVQRAETAVTASPRATSAEAVAPAFPRQGGGVLARTDGPIRRRGAQPQNTNALRHGKRSAAAVERRKQGATARKVAAAILVQLRLLPAYRCRPRPIRPDQLRHLDVEGLELLRRLGLS